MQLSQSPARYNLVVKSYPSEGSIGSLCQLIYESRDPKLVASLSSLPYTVGRSFSVTEADFLSEEMKKLRIGFSFRSGTADLSDINFDPNEKVVEPSSPSPSIQFRLLYFKYFVFALIALSIGVLTWGFLTRSANEPTLGLNPGSGTATEFRARIESFTKTVEFRRSRDLIWTRVDAPVGLMDQDSVRTFDASQALIRYREGTSLTIKSNTLVVIAAQTNESERRINLEDGSISARLIPSKEPQRLSIHTKLGTLEMTSPSEAGKDARFETSLRGEKLAVSVTSGEMRLTPIDKNKPSVKIQSNQRIEATPESISAPEPFVQGLDLLLPSDGDTMRINPQEAQPARFVWEDLGPGFEYEWILASDQELKNVLLSQKVITPFLSVQYVDLGTVYWRVTGKHDGTEFQSKVHKLNVQNNN